MTIPARVTVIIPARDDAPLLAGCLEMVVPQARSAGAAVLVVDDASTDATRSVAESLGAQVLSLPRPGGPYRARNSGWRSTSSELLAFTDVRSRPQPGWLNGLIEAMDNHPDVAIAGGHVRALSGASLASRVFAHREGLSAAQSMNEQFLPYLSTCNLITRRTVLESLGGFREARSGGDLDLCWRAQLETGARLLLTETATVEWLPRDSLRALLRQIYRYGVTRPHLNASFASAGNPSPAPPTRAHSAYYELRQLVRGLRRSPRPEFPGELVERVWDFVYWEGYRSSWVELHGPLPKTRPRRGRDT